MIQYTTPVLEILLEDYDVAGTDNVYVTFTDHFRKKEITIENPPREPSEEGTVLKVHLTQEQTGSFSKNNPIDLEVNIKTRDGERLASDIIKVCVHENLIKEVL